MLRRLDHWIGKHLFVPLIIRFCQLTGWTQFRVYWTGWMVAAFVLIWFGEAGWLGLAILIPCALINVLFAGLFPDMPTPENFWLRAFLLFLSVPLHAAEIAFRGYPDWSNLFPLIALFAEYARTIKTIPPKETKEAKRKLARQEG